MTTSAIGGTQPYIAPPPAGVPVVPPGAPSGGPIVVQRRPVQVGTPSPGQPAGEALPSTPAQVGTPAWGRPTNETLQTGVANDAPAGALDQSVRRLDGTLDLYA